MDLLMRYIWRGRRLLGTRVAGSVRFAQSVRHQGRRLQVDRQRAYARGPADLTMPTFDDRYRDRPGSATASGLAASTQPARTGLLPAIEAGRVERAGDAALAGRAGERRRRRGIWRGTSGSRTASRWRSSARTSGSWKPTGPRTRGYCRRTGCAASLGGSSTWSTTTGERDRFRTRIERGAQAGTVEIFISHRGMVEVPTKKEAMDFQWKMKEANPELEAEMLQRLLVRLGTPEQAAQVAVTKQPEVSLAKVEKRADGSPQLAFDDQFDRAWRRVGLAPRPRRLTVVDRDRQKGMYFVKYVDPDGSPSSKKDEGWLSKLAFWRKEDTSRFQEQYRIVVAEDRRQGASRGPGQGRCVGQDDDCREDAHAASESAEVIDKKGDTPPCSLAKLGWRSEGNTDAFLLPRQRVAKATAWWSSRQNANPRRLRLRAQRGSAATRQAWHRTRISFRHRGHPRACRSYRRRPQVGGALRHSGLAHVRDILHGRRTLRRGAQRSIRSTVTIRS